MRQSNFALALLAAAVLAGCGGGGAGDQTTKIKFSSQVSFGDSLSDVGTYAVGTVAALKGGKYNVNDVDSTGKNNAKNWTELMAAQLGLPAPCPAQTGLNGLASQGFSVPVVNHAGCTSYAQGGARVTNPVGPGNKLLGGSNAVLGQLTVPVVTQIQNHLALNGGSFKGDEIVFVMAGGNDVFIQLATLSSGATAAATAAVTAAVPGQIALDIKSGKCVPADAQASNCQAAAIATLTPTVGAAAAAAYVQTNAPVVVTAMGTAGAELAGYVKTLIVGKGAKYVTVVNLPDISQTPLGLGSDTATQGLISTMVTTFNAQLRAGLDGNASVLYVDAYTVNRDQAANPAIYGLTNVTTPACDLSAAKNALGSSLVCNKSNTISANVDNYEYADTVHPTPYGYLLLARYVSKEMVVRGWL
ncbi:SGNH/GDSL hydrolase family protein [Undibacterium sp. RTI2.1]|uniref:SGNH/GDSL hydrolase family protein n=1 Tax=unclassified Undibacterium TaxID=2630295 RepID=UPI002AB4CDEC|nr:MULTISPECIES: SGNH/GDSL hydrolase family protein [unclassified Undibacterium]MDY7538904.1 SGNH/GDSL hydrolase family protein [Undibacterium sp. 5I1]MEB0030842.1 SGNH/GDSL hydrolase family protein [Undibacterium sp. RTI2.1]MEB0117315.1 SGNH/GDSL hydrolase family protein [Undibacterium sp. RTI2.2]MEB0231028.1 SGNH/GDSL hydrolase family protein [Undibacterium sp. 10I3]MEB0257789.1 SGNH/GDSL hydrolase family protein [Undibacterium sp. 5I1]